MWIVRDVVMIGFAVGLMPVSVDADRISLQRHMSCARPPNWPPWHPGSWLAILARSRAKAAWWLPSRRSRAHGNYLSSAMQFVCMLTDRAVAQAIGGGVVASLVGAIICFTATAASAEGPLKFAGSQLEPIKWSRARGLDGR